MASAYSASGWFLRQQDDHGRDVGQGKSKADKNAMPMLCHRVLHTTKGE
jgi:hypothetical protein